MCMYDIDRFTGYAQIRLVLAMWEHLPEANLHLQDKISNEVYLWTEHSVDLSWIYSPWSHG